MDVKPKAEQRCIFFLVPLIVGCTIVAAVTVETVHLLLRFFSGYAVADHWPVFLAVGVCVAGVVAIARRLAHHRPVQSLETRRI